MQAWRVLSLRWAMCAGSCVEAGICQLESFYWFATDDVRIDDFVHVVFGHMSIPDGVRVDDNIRAVLALVEAAGLVGADFAFQAAFSQLLFEELLQAGLGGGIAAPAWVPRRALITTDKDVLIELWHGVFT